MLFFMVSKDLRKGMERELEYMHGIAIWNGGVFMYLVGLVLFGGLYSFNRLIVGSTIMARLR